VHEILVSEEECHRTVDRGNYYSILPILPEVRAEASFTPALQSEYGSDDNVMSRADLADLLEKQQLMVGDSPLQGGELLR
jgi:UDP-glucose 4-epimerase